MADEPTPTPKDVAADAAPRTISVPSGETSVTVDLSTEDAVNWQDKFTGQQKVNRDLEKKLHDALGRINEFEDRDKTETQRLVDENAALKAAKAKSDRAELVARVAMTHRLDADDLDLLHGDSEEELTARAERIARLRAAAMAANATPPPTPSPGQRPVEQLRPGATPTQTQSEDDVVYAKLFGAEAK